MVGKAHTTLRERFEAKVMPEPMSGCWLWLGCPMGNGYGSIWDPARGDKIGAHVASYILHRGEVPKGMVVRHKCDVPACVNPDHLELGTKAENQTDMVARGRSTRGARNPAAKLSPSDVAEIRARLGAGEYQRIIAKRFGVGQSLISQIAKGKIWSHAHD